MGSAIGVGGFNCRLDGVKEGVADSTSSRFFGVTLVDDDVIIRSNSFSIWWLEIMTGSWSTGLDMFFSSELKSVNELKCSRILAGEVGAAAIMGLGARG